MTASARHVDDSWARLSGLWLTLLAPSLVFANGRWQLAVAALTAPLLARLYLHSQPALRGLGIFFLLQLVANWIMWWRVIPAPGLLYFIIAAAYACCYFLPFAVDRLAAGRSKGFASTLVLPLSWYLVEILVQRFTPYGSWSSAGYTQMGHGLLNPLAAWAGVSGVAFVTVWIASVAAWLVMSTATLRRRALAASLFLMAVAALTWLASAPLTAEPGAATAVQVAGITPPRAQTLALDRELLRVRQNGDFSDAAMSAVGELAAAVNNDLLQRSRRAAEQGARIVVWSETAARVLDSEEGELVARAQSLAAELNIYLFLGLGVWHPDSKPPVENKVTTILPSGEIAWQYHKARPIVGSEAHILPPGHNDLATLDTPFGRIGLVICHDADFADFLVQAGLGNVDLLVVPSADWAAIADLHANMSIMRAVENGVWLLRPVYDGLSVIASPSGEVLYQAYDAELESRILAGSIPAAQVKTAYPSVGRYLPFLAAVLLAGVVGFSRAKD